MDCISSNSSAVAPVCVDKVLRAVCESFARLNIFVANSLKASASSLTPPVIAEATIFPLIISPRLTAFPPASSILFPAAVMSSPKIFHFLPVLSKLSSVSFNSVCWSAKAARDSLTFIVFFAIASSCFLIAFSALACASFVSSSCAFSFLLSSLSLPVALTLPS